MWVTVWLVRMTWYTSTMTLRCWLVWTAHRTARFKPRRTMVSRSFIAVFTQYSGSIRSNTCRFVSHVCTRKLTVLLCIASQVCRACVSSTVAVRIIGQTTVNWALNAFPVRLIRYKLNQSVSHPQLYVWLNCKWVCKCLPLTFLCSLQVHSVDGYSCVTCNTATTPTDECPVCTAQLDVTGIFFHVTLSDKFRVFICHARMWCEAQLSYINCVNVSRYSWAWSWRVVAWPRALATLWDVCQWDGAGRGRISLWLLRPDAHRAAWCRLSVRRR